MDVIDKISKIYRLPVDKNKGFAQHDIAIAERRLKITLPKQLKHYYQNLGKHQAINESHNRLLDLNKIRLTDDGYLVFYEENQQVVVWGIQLADLTLDNPKVYGDYGSTEHSDWHIESEALDEFLLLMAIYNGTMGGLTYHGNTFESIDSKVVACIKNDWDKIDKISHERLVIYTDNFDSIISLSYDTEGQVEGIFIGSNDQNKFDAILNKLQVNWDYLSYDDRGDQ